MRVNHGRFDIFMPEQFLYRLILLVGAQDIVNSHSSEKAQDIVNISAILLVALSWRHAVLQKETAWTTAMSSSDDARQSAYG